MSSGFPDRVTQLRSRWQNDPSSRVFLQLAEEYRHLGRSREALEVLEAGLKEHPGYLSALVAQGRCLLELGEAEAARRVLERVVQQDVTQMVASKLLVRAYLEIGEGELARQRLDLYGLLNDGDPEIEDLKRRVAAMNREGLPETPAPAGEPDEPFPWKAPTAPRGGDVFDLDASSFGPRVEPAAAPFPAPVVAEAPSPANPFDLPAVAARKTEADDPFDPFPDLAPSAGSRSHLDHLASEGIFWFEAPPAPAAEIAEPAASEPAAARSSEPWAADPFPGVAPLAAPVVAPPEWSFDPTATAAEAPVAPIAATEPLAEDETFWSVEPSPTAPAEDAAAGWQVVPAPMEPPTVPDRLADASSELFELEPPAVAEPAAWSVVPVEPLLPVAPALAEAAETVEPSEPLAPIELQPAAAASIPTAGESAGSPTTVTLGQLYLRQGHMDEAERIFLQVLERDPGNAVAQRELERIDRRRRPLEAGRLLAGFEAPASAPGRARKVHLLHSYLQLLRRASENHVS